MAGGKEASSGVNLSGAPWWNAVGIRVPRMVIVGVASLSVAACVTAPRETIELSDVVAEQASSLERSHRLIVDAYFSELERRIDDFIDTRWTPDFLARAAASDQVRSATEEIRAGLGIDPDRLRRTVLDSRSFSDAEANIIVGALQQAQFDYRTRFGQVMIDFSEAALRQINAQRRTLKEPLEQNRRNLLSALDESYSDLQAGQAAIRAYLASVVELVEEQDRILAKLDVLKERDAAMNAAVEASDAAVEATDKLLKVEERFENFRKDDKKP
jgi:hypothetical protein